MWDESRNAVQSLEMALNNEWIIVTYNAEPELWSTKPPSLNWLQAVCIKLFGINEFAVGLPSALSILALVV